MQKWKHSDSCALWNFPVPHIGFFAGSLWSIIGTTGFWIEDISWKIWPMQLPWDLFWLVFSIMSGWNIITSNSKILLIEIQSVNDFWKRSALKGFPNVHSEVGWKVFFENSDVGRDRLVRGNGGNCFWNQIFSQSLDWISIESSLQIWRGKHRVNGFLFFSLYGKLMLCPLS